MEKVNGSERQVQVGRRIHETAKRRDGWLSHGRKAMSVGCHAFAAHGGGVLARYLGPRKHASPPRAFAAGLRPGSTSDPGRAAKAWHPALAGGPYLNPFTGGGRS